MSSFKFAKNRAGQSAADRQQVRQYLATLTPEERAKYLERQRELNAPEQEEEPAAPVRPQQAPRSPFRMPAYGVPNPMMNGLLNPAEQAGYLNRMAAQATEAHQDEMDSRVAQSREMRRMQQERDMEAMRQESLLRRLAIEQEEREKDRILQKQLTSGVITRQLVNGKWVDV
jgi:hypothetical protein